MGKRGRAGQRSMGLRKQPQEKKSVQAQRIAERIAKMNEDLNRVLP